MLAKSITDVSIFVLKVSSARRALAGVAVKVVSLLDATGVADILMQVVKLSDDS